MNQPLALRVLIAFDWCGLMKTDRYATFPWHWGMKGALPPDGYFERRLTEE
jgi:hypothetical protein